MYSLSLDMEGWRAEEGQREWLQVWGVVAYLDLTSLHQRAVELLSGPLCIRTQLEGDKTKALTGEEEEEGLVLFTTPDPPTPHTHTVAYLRTPLVEDDLHVKDFAELLKQQQQRMRSMFMSHSDHREAALSSHEDMEPASFLPLLFLSSILGASLFLNSTAPEHISP